MRKSDVVELIRVDLPDHTEGAFDVKIESDDGGNHIVIYLEEHIASQYVMEVFSKRFSDQRIIIMKVPENFLNSNR